PSSEMASRFVPDASTTRADQPPKSAAGEVSTRPPRNSSGPKRFASGLPRSKCAIGRAAISICSTRSRAPSSARAHVGDADAAATRSPPSTARRSKRLSRLLSVMAVAPARPRASTRAGGAARCPISLQFAAARGRLYDARRLGLPLFEQLDELVGHGARELG